ncbi:polysaccharide lyase [Maribellus maritimus]|nr:polysaccharide lyase [Maribellus maritimus]
MTDQFHRTGNHCVKLEFKKGYIRQDGGDGNFTERTELDSGTHPTLHQKMWYKFSILILEDFPIIDNRLVISQVKQTVLLKNPLQLYAQRYRNGNHYLTIYNMTSSKKEQAARYELPELTKGKWHDFILQIYYSDSTDGYINMWMDGKKVVSFIGPTASKKGRNQFYHKIGMYRDQYSEPMTIYFDNYILTNDTLLTTNE